MTTYVFTGPTLSPEEARVELDAVYLPPVSQGDVYRAALKRPRAIGIIDGYFEHVPAVWHKEILWAMSQGIHVYGSASMGALRAAELAPFGMVGVGVVFEAYRDGALEDDDEVAVVHGTAESGYLPGSDAMVDIRCTLAKAETVGVIESSTRLALGRIAKSLFYPERSYPLILQRAIEQGLLAAELGAFRTWLPHGRVSQKREDALAMLRVMRERLLADPEPKHVDFVLEHTTVWDRALRSAGVADVAVEGDTITVILDSVVEELLLNGSACARACQAAMLRHLALCEARRSGYVASADAVAEISRRFRRSRGLTQPEEFNRWLEGNHLTRERFDELMHEEVLITSVRNHLREEALHRLLDVLRLTGQYSNVLARVRHKQRTLETYALQNPDLRDVGITAEALLKWYFEERLPPVAKADIEEYTALGDSAYADSNALIRAALREYCYLRLQENRG